MDDVLEILCTPTHVTMDVSRAINRAVA